MNSNSMENKVVYLRLDDIIPNRFQPREVFDETGLEELADSIKEHGVIQPIIVRPIGDKYELIAGERRSKASAMAGLTTIPAIVRQMDDKESAKVSLLENLQRKNLSAIEEARTYKKILELDNMTQEDLAKTMGKSQPLIANKLRLLSLPEEVQDALIKNQISERHARSLLNVKDKKEQLLLLDKIRTERLTVRELDALIKPSTNNFEAPITEEISYTNSSPSSPVTANNLNNNYLNNYSNMGLNDYQSSVNNNMFNNIPNYQNLNNQFNNMPNMSTTGMESNDIDYSDFASESNTLPIQEETPLQEVTTEGYTSLGSMLDGGENINNTIETDTSFDNADSRSPFISQIKENEVQKTGNQFLPNFDDIPTNGPGADFSNNQNNYLNEPNNFLNDRTDFNDSFGVNNPISYEDSSINNNLSTDYTTPINDFTASNTYLDNQGGLFNQPLNIVSVPNEESSMDTSYLADTNLNDSTGSSDSMEVSDTSYENLLFAKPVPIKNEDTSNETLEKKETEEASNQYVSIDPVRTIFNAREAVMELKKTTDQIKASKINLDTEEIDFDDYYQITIRIKKE